MPISYLLAFIVILAVTGFYLGRRRAGQVAEGHTSALHSRPGYHGLFVAAWCGLPSLILVMVWLLLSSQIADWLLLAAIDADTATLTEEDLARLSTQARRLAAGTIEGEGLDASVVAVGEAYARLQTIAAGALTVVVLLASVAGLFYARKTISRDLRARQAVERVFNWIMIAASTIAILITVGIVLSLLFESLRFFAKVSPLEFIFGLHWSPQTALRADQVGASGSFGAIPLFAGTALITLIAMTMAVPIGLFSAIYLSEYAGPRFRAWVKPMLEILAGIPTVVYGFFAALTVAPVIRGWGEGIGLSVASESALAAGVVMGLMIIPFVSSLTDDVMNAVPQSLRDGSYGLGATQAETIRNVIVPAALPGIIGAVLLAVSRAIGETMIVVMAAGLAANLTANPLEAVTTVTVQIVTLLVGDQEFDSAKTLAAFALGLTLFLVTLSLNVVALRTVRKYREKYD
jgi:phosphate transport system permease protein